MKLKRQHRDVTQKIKGMTELSEIAPPGFGHTKSGKGDKKGGTAAAFDRARKEGRFKGSKSDMFAIMWSQKNKGDKPHYKPGTNKKYKKYQEEEATFKQRDKELKKTSVARKQRYSDLHKKTGNSNVDVNENLDNLKEKNYSGCPKKDKAPDFDAKKELKNKYPKAVEESQTRYYRDDKKGQTKQSFSDFYKKAKLAKHKKQSDKTYIDTKRHGVKFSDAKGSGRIRSGKKYYD